MHLAREVEEVDVRVIVGNKSRRRHTQFQHSPWFCHVIHWIEIELSGTGSGEMINEEEEEEDEEEEGEEKEEEEKDEEEEEEEEEE